MSISIQSLKEAISLKEEISSLEARLKKILGGGNAPAAVETTAKPGRKRRRKMSASARARIAAAQKARWAKIKGIATAPAAKKRKRRGLSPEGRARIIAAQKKRWAAIKKG